MKNAEEKLKRKTFLIELLPKRIVDSIKRALQARGKEEEDIEEIRLRVYGRSGIKIYGVFTPCLSPSRAEMKDVVLNMTEASPYAFRDYIANGFIPFEGGVRVGIAGRAHYESGQLVGINEYCALNIRIPTKIPYIHEIEEAFSNTVRGMIVYSLPGVGKTTALRSLVRSMGARGVSVAVIDERCEMPPEFFSGTVDVYSGYKRALGMELALRTMSPELLVVDEIAGKREAELISEYLNSGVKFVASAHSGGFGELLKKPAIRPFLEIGAFDTAFGITRRGREYTYEVIKIDA